jgi:2-keto-4-pentenoate hydratase/2-oxohepta-3-ene-1,7-dioic acid hydratase in catechol pathway
MKLLTYRHDGGAARLGALRDGEREVVDLAAAYRSLDGTDAAELASMLALIEAGTRGRNLAAEALEGAPGRAILQLSEVDLMAPLPEPRKLRDFLAFEGHLKNMAAQMKTPTPIPQLWYERPIYAKCNHLSVVGSDVEVIWPPYAEQLDFELELACVIGFDGKDVPAAEAERHIFGFTIYNDVSARDEQIREWGPMGSMKGKDFDTGNILGPWIVTADEVGDPYSLEMVVRVNGEEWGRGNTRDMYYRWDAMIAYASYCETIRAGEVLGSGTVPSGSGAEQGRFPRPGDVIEMEVERIGTLRNRFGHAADRSGQEAST